GAREDCADRRRGGWRLGTIREIDEPVVLGERQRHRACRIRSRRLAGPRRLRGSEVADEQDGGGEYESLSPHWGLSTEVTEETGQTVPSVSSVSSETSTRSPDQQLHRWRAAFGGELRGEKHRWAEARKLDVHRQCAGHGLPTRFAPEAIDERLQPGCGPVFDAPHFNA